MAITLPIGIRIAAGLLGSTIDRIGKLPQELPTLGVSLVGQAVRTSFRIRQEIAELATRGDELLAGITGRPEEKPAWATFDEDDETETPASTQSARSTRSAGTAAPDVPGPTAPTGAAPTVPAPTVPAPTVSVPTNRVRAARKAAAPAPRATRTPAATSAPVGSPMPVRGDHLLSIAELKEELQDMDVAAVRELLVLEETGPHRAAYLTLLSNRLTTLAHENGQSEIR